MGPELCLPPLFLRGWLALVMGSFSIRKAVHGASPVGPSKIVNI